VNNLAGGALFGVVSADAASMGQMPPVMDFNCLPDMGRMNG
jgi:hypothetical protein